MPNLYSVRKEGLPKLGSNTESVLYPVRDESVSGSEYFNQKYIGTGSVIRHSGRVPEGFRICVKHTGQRIRI
jgi:hypothetical protein